MRSVEWSADALRDFQAAIEFIAGRSDTSALLVAQRILTAIDLLADLPTGHQGRVNGTYEKVVRRTHYIVAYTMSDQVIYVLRVIHGSRDWPEGEWPNE